MAQLLLEAGADLDLPSSDGTTSLMNAALGGKLNVLWLLLARGAAVDAVDACDQKYPDCVETLVRAGCDVGLESCTAARELRCRTGRHVAEQRGQTAVVERLNALARDPMAGAVAQVRDLVGAPEHNGQRVAVR